MGLLRWPLPHEVLPGRPTRMPVPQQHYVLQTPLTPPFPTNLAVAMFGMGCFWGAEKKFWQTDGVFSTAVGYSGGVTPNPFYEEVCSGMTAHNEVVQVVFDPAVVPFTDLLRLFWQGHNPTTGMRQGNDIGTQYRSAIYCLDDKQLEEARHSAKRYQQALDKAGMGMITTEILPAQDFYYAEPYHQQYLARNPSGYCPDITCQATGLPAFPS